MDPDLEQVTRVETLRRTNKGVWLFIVSGYLALGVGGIVAWAVGGPWWKLVGGVIWLLAGACWWIWQLVLRRRERSAVSES